MRWSKLQISASQFEEFLPSLTGNTDPSMQLAKQGVRGEGWKGGYAVCSSSYVVNLGLNSLREASGTHSFRTAFVNFKHHT